MFNFYKDRCVAGIISRYDSRVYLQVKKLVQIFRLKNVFSQAANKVLNFLEMDQITWFSYT
ncbi:hypothetical protein C3K47_15405 [Solitalea longa]|uniref:Uncharacterized protein n=1 Tax=Solitalea longa TaxID=2079460 RepID=A0A2S4ZYP1_9SPHI|nr:hypothetical protein C3K47_15405 [Solitalea longa]